MNLYRGRAHNCASCDGRAEKYRVEGEFASEVCAKVNAVEVLRRELAPRGKPAAGSGEPWPELADASTPPRASARGGRGRAAGRGARPPGGFVMVGGGVGDAYQPLEEKYRLTRGAMELPDELGLPVHALTKSTLVLRDLDLLSKINGVSRAAVSFSMSSVDDAVASAKAAGADYVVFGGMTLKEGPQKEHFTKVLPRRGSWRKYWPRGPRPSTRSFCPAPFILLPRGRMVYSERIWIKRNAFSRHSRERWMPSTGLPPASGTTSAYRFWEG
jgi:hypothetical protein